MESFEYLDDLFEPVLVAELDHSIAYYNASFLVQFKTTPRLMQKQKSVLEYLSPIIPDFEDFFNDIVKNGQAVTSELNFFIEGQMCTLIVKGVKKDLDCIMLLFKDVTVEKQLNDKYHAQLEELKNTYSQVLQSDKLKVIGEMTANISHEINNPLTVAVGNAELISFCLEAKDINTQKDNIDKYNNNVNHSLERINKIISNMKEFLHQSEDKKEYCNANEIIDKSIAFATPSLKGSAIKIDVKYNSASPILLVNKIKIEQVFVNLLNNAVDSLKELNILNPKILIELTVEKNGNFIRIDVKDNGAGISKENRAKIFNAFFTTKEIGKGTGLGLSISHQIIESHQGELELMDSKVGAHFRITLPAIGIAGLVNGNWEKLINEGDKLIRVLVVDNEINILNLCLNFLSDSEYSFLGASNAEEALREVERTTVNMIITDLKMPGMDGEGLVRELRKKNIHVPVLFMTSKDFVEKYKTMKDELDLKGIILKPFTKDELVSAIGAVIK
ncbi:MAG: response regulator [Bdellovibrionales bacterium]|nr:response regulator [Bdellovibrionales bacterium]